MPSNKEKCQACKGSGHDDGAPQFIRGYKKVVYCFECGGTGKVDTPKPLYRTHKVTGVPMLTKYGEEVMSDYIKRKLADPAPTQEKPNPLRVINRVETNLTRTRIFAELLDGDKVIGKMWRDDSVAPNLQQTLIKEEDGVREIVWGEQGVEIDRRIV